MLVIPVESSTFAPIMCFFVLFVGLQKLYSAGCCVSKGSKCCLQSKDLNTAQKFGPSDILFDF